MKQALIPALGAAVVFVVFALPNHPDAMGWGAFTRWPLELPVLLLFMVLLGRRAGVTHLVASVLVILTVLKLADYVMFMAYNRPFNPIVDGSLINAGFEFARDSLGVTWVGVALVFAAFLLVLWFLVLLRSLVSWAELSPSGKTTQAAGVAALGCFVWAVADAGHHMNFWKFQASPPGTTWTTRLAIDRVDQMQRTSADLVQFRQAALSDIYANRSGLLNQLDERNVILIWIESYGRASFDNPLYAPTHLATLRTAQNDLSDLGFAMKSGWLTSPTAGGQSWLAHGALGAGLWTTDNGRYQAMIDSGKKWLFHIAQDAGYRTTAIMPAITRDWPESDAMGFDLILNQDALGYEGEPFRWVTMPDQFTLATYRDLLPPDPRPDFIQIALISSHAPWTPIPDLIRWEDVGSGTVFNEMAARGPEPEVLWKDKDAVRDAYRRSVDYVLNAVFSHVAQLADDAPLIVVAGDHQAAGFVSGSGNMDVAVHMIGPHHVLDRIEHWGWTDGLVPGADVPVRRMDSFRDDFISAFSGVTSTAMVAK
ncbi:sulfatase-like hydrolase/transferase [Ruegeria profundi]|uniref:sulfatase-like hydrolase/transferase n=1 Tax=Ruegeria profundi TaxID=1685378 RepID=UPI001CD8015F|nr:sulfatase-like hydrolase/transferase [Ruegeria profundi]MCA0928086.1 sulfatase-like hydrolase/transferase [Ruegeria profundi]